MPKNAANLLKHWNLFSLRLGLSRVPDLRIACVSKAASAAFLFLTTEKIMIQVQLPDGSKRPFENPVSVFDVAASIGAGLAKAALAGKVDGKLVDTSFVIDQDAELSIITDKDTDGLAVIRHSTAHLLAYAVKELFPDAQVTIGPVIEDGFFYDFSYKRPFTPDDLTKIEAKMTELAKKDASSRREVVLGS